VALVLKATAERTIPARKRTDLHASRGYGKLSRSPYCCTLLLYAPLKLSPLGAFCLVGAGGFEPPAPRL
jgi:hypothetical protein